MEPSSYQMLPQLTREQYEALKADIAARGIQVPIEVDEQGHVLDGHHRLRAARELGLDEHAIPKVVRRGLSEGEKLEHVLRLNLLRRQLSRSERRKLAVELRRRGWTQERIAQCLGVHQSQISRWLRDVMQTHNVPAGAEASSLPATITDARGRRQPGTKVRRRSARAEAQEAQPEARSTTADASVMEQPTESYDPEELALIEEPTPAYARVAEPSPADNTPSAPPDRVGTLESAAGTEPQLGPHSDGIVGASAFSYFRACQPARFAEPGPLSPPEYDRALSFEAVLCLLRRLQNGEAAEVLDPWRRWHEHHGNPRAAEEAADVLAYLARTLRPQRDIARHARTASRAGREVGGP